MKHPQKILFAAVDIGHRIELYSKFILERYPDTLFPESLSLYVLPEKHYKSNYTYEYHFHKRSASYRWFRSFLNYASSVFKYDIFHFISGETLLPRKLRRFELFTYKLLGKKVIMQFVGSDIRDPDYIRWKTNNIQQFLNGSDPQPKSKLWQKKLIADANRFADHILVSTPDLKELIPAAEYYPVVLDLEKYLKELDLIPDKEKNADEIVILHSPSNNDLKGTIHIHEILKKLASDPENKIRLILPDTNKKENETRYPVSRYELFGLYKEADLIIDQLIIGWYGLQSIEALAAQKEVICYIDEPLKPFLFPECPIRIADITNFEQIVLEAIKNIRAQKATAGKKHLDWVKKYHTIESNNSGLLKSWGLPHS